MSSDDANIHNAALSYLVIMLIQRMDKMQDGFSQELMDGIKSDKEAAGVSSGSVAAIFDKALAIVEQAAQFQDQKI